MIVNNSTTVVPGGRCVRSLHVAALLEKGAGQRGRVAANTRTRFARVGLLGRPLFQLLAHDVAGIPGKQPAHGVQEGGIRGLLQTLDGQGEAESHGTSGLGAREGVGVRRGLAVHAAAVTSQMFIMETQSLI